MVQKRENTIFNIRLFDLQFEEKQGLLISLICTADRLITVLLKRTVYRMMVGNVARDFGTRN